MTIQEVIKKIDRYLKKDNVEPLIVDVQNEADLDAIMLHYKLPQNVFLCASDTEFCKADEFPIIPNILERLANENSSFFVSEISSFFMLKGEKALVQELKELLSMSIAGHAVILTFQCDEYLRTLIKSDRRVDSRSAIHRNPQEQGQLPIFSLCNLRPEESLRGFVSPGWNDIWIGRRLWQQRRMAVCPGRISKIPFVATAHFCKNREYPQSGYCYLYLPAE